MQENNQKKSLIKQNILKYLDYKGDTMYQCYANTGITRGVLGQDNGMSEDNVSKFLAYYKDINVEWLLTSKGEMLKSDTSELTAITPIKQSTIKKEDNTLLNHLQNENKELKEEISTLNAENKALNKEIGKLEGKLEDACELIESLKKEIPVPGFLRAVK